MLQAENMKSRHARCSRVVISKLLAARKAIFFISARARLLANARKDHSSPLNLHVEDKVNKVVVVIIVQPSQSTLDA